MRFRRPTKTRAPVATDADDLLGSRSGRDNRASWVPLFVAICLVAINLRMMIAGVGPLLDYIAADQGVSPTALGILTAIPLLSWGTISPLAQVIAARFGLDLTVYCSLVILAVATVWRSIPGTIINLWLGTVLIGAALAIINVLLPASIKRDFRDRIPFVMGVYSALIGASGAIGAVMTSPIAALQAATFTDHRQADAGLFHTIVHALTPLPSQADTLGWRWALLATGATVPISVCAWAWANRRRRRATQFAGDQAPTTPQRNSGASARAVGLRVWRDPVAWCIAFYLGAQSGMFYIFAGWLSPVIISRGTDPVIAGFDVTLFHIFGTLGSLLAPLCLRGSMAKITPILLPITGLIGGASILLVTPVALPIWLAIAGLSCGMSLSVSLTFVAQRAVDASAAGAVSGMSQSFGYLLAGAGPMLFGWLYQESGSWVQPWLVLAGAAGIQLIAGVALLRPRMALAHS